MSCYEIRQLHVNRDPTMEGNVLWLWSREKNIVSMWLLKLEFHNECLQFTEEWRCLIAILGFPHHVHMQ